MIIAPTTTTTIRGHCGQTYLNIRLNALISKIFSLLCRGVSFVFQTPSYGYGSSTVTELLLPVKSKGLLGFRAKLHKNLEQKTVVSPFYEMP
jgi:hypothetical protein